MPLDGLHVNRDRAESFGSLAERMEVFIRTHGDALVVEVLDDGIGGADEDGSGLRGLADRIEAIGGTLALESPPGAGTRLLAQIPLP